MSNLQVTLPDGSVQSVPAGAAPIDVARSISPRLADDALVAKVNGNLWDLNRPLEADSTLQILTPKNPEALEVYRHSTAHLLAAAVLELFPETKLGVGPAHRKRFLLRLPAAGRVLARGSRKDREKDVGAAGARICPTSASTWKRRKG